MILSIYKKLFDDDKYYLIKGNPTFGNEVNYNQHDITMIDEVLEVKLFANGFFVCNSNVFGKVIKDTMLVIAHEYKTEKEIKKEKLEEIETEYFEELTNKIYFQLELLTTLKHLNIK